MLLMDGVIYEEWTPTSHDELAQMIREHSKEIFGQESIYLDIRQKLKGGSIAAIPDAYCLTFGPDTFWMIEVERSATDSYSHIVNQLSRFINGLNSPQSQRELRDAVYSNMSQSDRERAQSRSGGAVHPWLEKLINQLSLIVITEKAADGIPPAVATLRITPRVYEFRTFCREGVGLAVHIHLFEPLYAHAPVAPAQVTQAVTPPASSPPLPLQQMPVAKGKRVTHAVSLADMLNARLVSPGQRIFGEYPIGKVWHGEILASGQVRTLHDGAVFRSLSSAASQIRKYPVDGWTWWKTKDELGQVVKLAQLREKLEQRRP